jgi:hypothetical protein
MASRSNVETRSGLATVAAENGQRRPDDQDWLRSHGGTPDGRPSGFTTIRSSVTHQHCEQSE